MIGYIIDAWHERAECPEMRVLDSRGPGHIMLSPWHFARCLLTIAIVSPRQPLLHVHVAGRGSTIRKIILVHFARLLRLPVVLHLHDYNYRELLQRFPRFIQLAARSMFRIPAPSWFWGSMTVLSSNPSSVCALIVWRSFLTPSLHRRKNAELSLPTARHTFCFWGIQVDAKVCMT